MNNGEFKEASESFDMKEYRRSIRPLEKLRREFISQFTIDKIRHMKLDEYCQGKGIKENNFCYGLENTLKDLGDIHGSSCTKFGMYWSKKSGQYKIVSRFDQGSPQKSLKVISDAIIDLLEAGKDEDLERIRANSLSKMFKGKILATYYPEKYLSIFSEDHLDYYINQLGLDHYLPKNADVIDKREALIQFKLDTSETRDWPLHAFARFLYHDYPKAPKSTDVLAIEQFEYAEFTDGDYISVEDYALSTKSGKGEYEQQFRERQRLGVRGEYIVFRFESERLKSLGIRKKPKHVSKEDDCLGYDIESYNEDGTKRYIEVKATNAPLDKFHFFLSANELGQAKLLGENYHVYVVSKPNSARPKIQDLGNPFIVKDKIILIPTTYKINIVSK